MPDDLELLRRFVGTGSDEPFRELIERHAGMVHQAARRIVRNEHLAQEVTQAVFIILARKAPQLPSGIVVAGWLYRTTRFVSWEALRTENRRQHHQHDLAAMSSPGDSRSVWDQITPGLEEAMGRLAARERDAIVLRFFEGRPFAEVAGALGITEAAAKMRISRAIEKLRGALTRQGVVIPAAALTAALTAHSAAAADPGFCAAMSSTALGTEAAPESSVGALVKQCLATMSSPPAKSTILAAAACVLIGALVFVAWQSLAPRAHLSNFEPMLGTWAGTYQSHGDGLPLAGIREEALLHIVPKDRSIQIEMRLGSSSNSPMVFHFEHRLNEPGTRIFTADDPLIARVNGDGEILISRNEPATGTWEVAFRNTLPDRAGIMECRWMRQGDALLIRRHDLAVDRNRDRHLYSELSLRRSAGPAVKP